MALNRIYLWTALIGPALAFGLLSGAHAAEFKLLHEFTGGPSDGETPYFAGVRFDAAGNLYGTTQGGGVNYSGTLYKITPDGNETLLHSFDGQGGGSLVNSGVAIDEATGDIYGTTNGGGKGDFLGIIWKYAANGKFAVLYSFTGGSDGNGSDSRLIRDPEGNLYGTASGGYGKVFKYSADGQFSVLHSFNQTDGGIAPGAGLIRDRRIGTLYGVTYTDGAGGHGSVYKVNIDGSSFTTLYRFAGGADGAYAAGGLDRDKDGNLYGTTEQGGAQCSCGTVFKITPEGKHSILHTFTGGADGGRPDGDLLLLGNHLYGTTSEGGDSDYGVVFAINARGHETVLHAFNFSDGCCSESGLTKHGNTLYGATLEGGAHGAGVVFSVTKK
jgi:uncharacterized repeat protein (TIGR03803 family)